MKKMFAWLLAGTLALGLWGCAGEEAPAEISAPAETAAPSQETEETTMETSVPETETVSAEPLFLKVSSITFSVVGDSEDIYLGLAPRDQITWESDDPSVVSVDKGVLTATGVGTTTVRAVHGDQILECSAGCLAEDQEALKSLDPEILRKPMRGVPEVDLDSPCTFYDNAAMVGDSIVLMMLQSESPGDYLGNLLILARNGTSMMGLVQRFKNVFFQGVEMNLEDAIAASGVERVYMLVGSNDIACEPNRIAYFDNWDVMLERIREKSPGVEVVMISNTPRCKMIVDGKLFAVEVYNKMIRDYNEQLQQYCREHDYPYLDLSYYIEDHNGDMAKEYNLDGYHMNNDGYMQWIRLMRFYAEYEKAGGKLS